MRLAVGDEERAVLVSELDGFLETTAALYRQIGREWDPRDISSLGPEVAPVVHARAQLDGPGPWALQGSDEQLRFLLTRLRAGAELALQRGTQPSPASRSRPRAMNADDAEGTDAHLDILGVCDALVRRLDASPDGRFSGGR